MMRRTTIANSRSISNTSLISKNGNLRSRTSPPSTTNRYDDINKSKQANNNSSNDNNNPVSNSSNTRGSNIQVYVRCRSRNQREIDEKSSVVISTRGHQGKEVIFSSFSSPLSYQRKTYFFDQVFGAESDQELVFNTTAKNYIEEMLQGYNCTIFAYGQTGTGKTYTMSGDLNILGDVTSRDKILLGEHAGIIPRVLVDLFQRLDKEKGQYTVKISFLELYNERLKDLLSNDNNGEEESIRIFDNNSNNTLNNNTNLLNPINKNSNKRHSISSSNLSSNQNSSQLRSKLYNSNTTSNFGDNQSSIMVKGMDEIYIKSAFEGLQLLTEGSLKRKVAATKCNDLSSRSHTIFTVTTNIVQIDPISGEQFVKIGKLNLVDLAGSENINRSGAENKRAQEAGLINKSLLTLGRVINALVDHSQHIPYRESKLTRLLQDSLGGKTKTCIIATISPAKISMEETISTLEYATRAKSIKNTPQVNQSLAKDASLSTYINTIEKLQNDLRASRQKEGIYISQDQYDLYESNSILVNEQKMRIHNMEDQLEKFKKKYVEQTEINKELEQKCNSTEAEKKALQTDKFFLISLIEEYLQKWDNLSNEIKHIHNNNITLLNEINVERNHLCSDLNVNFDERKEMSTQILKQIDMLSKLQITIKDYNQRFETVLKGVNSELDTKTTQFETNTLKILEDINIDDVITSVEQMETSLKSCFKKLSEPRDALVQPIYKTHREIVENCLSDIKTFCKELEAKNVNLVTALSSTVNNNYQSFESMINNKNNQTSELIDNKIQYIQSLEQQLQQERQASMNMQKHIQSLQNYISKDIQGQRINMFENMSRIFKALERQQLELDQNIYEKSLLAFNDYNKETETATKKIFSDLTIGSIECMEDIQALNKQTNKELLTTIQQNYDAKKKLIDSISFSNDISELIKKLEYHCSQETSLKLQTVIDSTDSSISSNIEKANIQIMQIIKNLSNNVSSVSNVNRLQLSKLSTCVKELCEYILKTYHGNLFQISTTQNDILSDHYTNLKQITEELTILINSNTDFQEIKPLIDVENRIQANIPTFTQPKNYEIYKDMKEQDKHHSIPSNDTTEEMSPKPGTEPLTNPSTPVPVPDQPLPKVLVPKSINSTSKCAHIIPGLLKENDTKQKGENNLKRKFSTAMKPDNEEIVSDKYPNKNPR